MGPARASSADPPVVIVDQFEEAFTLCSDEAQRRTFIQLLHAACSPAAPAEAGVPVDPAPVLVVLGIRADFYEQCLGYPELADALQHRHMVLGPLATAELREAVTGPAKAVGLELEPGLAELIVRELSADGPRGAHDAGVLPLLSHALLATWQRRKAGRLTLAGYRAAGGIQGAVAATAEQAWSGLDPAARTAAGCSSSGWSGSARTPRPPGGGGRGASWRRSRRTPARRRNRSRRWFAPGW